MSNVYHSFKGGCDTISAIIVDIVLSNCGNYILQYIKVIKQY